MIIISKFHDYYDSGMSYGLDKNLRYIRKREETENVSEMPKQLYEMLKKLPDKYDYWQNSVLFSVRPFLIVLCGQVYLGYHLSGLKDPNYKNPLPEQTLPDKYIYNLHSLKKILEKYSKDEYQSFLKKSPTYRFLKSFNHDHLEEAFEEFGDKKIGVDIHIDEKAPILFIGHKKREYIYIKNPVLRDIHFYKRLVAFTVFQNISMFIGGVVSGTFPPMVELSEKERIQKQGFDKWSFRKMGKNSKL